MQDKKISSTNVKVKQDMYKSLMKLLNTKPISAISVSDITSEANVSRMSFYRNYGNIENILTEHLDYVVNEYHREDLDFDTDKSGLTYTSKKYLVHCFSFLYEHHDFIDVLISCGLGDMLLAKITIYLIQKWIPPKSDSKEEVLRISAYSGAIYNVYREWSRGAFAEPAEEIAKILYQ